MRFDTLFLTAALLGTALVPAFPLAAAHAQLPETGRDELFESMANQVIQGYLRANPETATQLGDHRYDGLLSDYSAPSLHKQITLARRARLALAAIPADALSQANQVDQAILLDKVDEYLYQLEEARDWQRNPMLYNPGAALDGLLSRDFAPLPQRLASVKARLLAVPNLLGQARANLANPPRLYTETAIRQLQGTLALIRNEVTEAASRAGLKDDLAPAQAQAAQALEAHLAWLKADLLPRSNGDFRVGRERFQRQLRFALNEDLPLDALFARARAGLKATQAEMAQVAAPLFAAWFPGRQEADPKVVIKAVLDRLGGQHPGNDTIVAVATRDLQTATAFVRDHNLVSVPAEPVRVIVMPEYQRGVAVAYCDSPGALETHGATFYAISPTPADWSAARAESFFREYNDAMVQDLTVHEAMPGHYLQGAHANAYRGGSPVRMVCASGPFVEGWAVYMEQTMARAGYGGPEVRMEQLKMRLRATLNAILDQGVHVRGMTEREAMDLMVNEGFQEEGEAAGKWVRACLGATQLSTYFVGATALDDLRAAAVARAAAEHVPFDEKAFHDRLLSFGSPAPRFARLLMGL